jgi:hypothetical protein
VETTASPAVERVLILPVREDLPMVSIIITTTGTATNPNK